MMRRTWVVLAVVIAGAGWLTSPAVAAAYTLAEWEAMESGYTIEDKAFVFEKSDLPMDLKALYTTVTFNWYAPSEFGPEQATVTLTWTNTATEDADYLSMDSTGYYLNYSVAIVDNPLNVFDEVAIDTDGATSTTSVAKMVLEPNLTITSTNGGTDSASIFGYSYISIHETFKGPGTISGSTNTFTQVAVPLPAAFWAGLTMLCGLGAVRRFRLAPSRKS